MLVRWLRFNFVGVLGVAVQLTVLAMLVSGLDWNYLPATLIAVEAAVLHNFAWHEHYTWADRRRCRSFRWWLRLLRFNFANGALSLVGNLVLMRMLVETAHLPYLAANLLSITACSVANFFAGDLWVFRQSEG